MQIHPSTMHIEVLRAFAIGGRVLTVGEVHEVAFIVGAEACTANKARRVAAPPPKVVELPKEQPDNPFEPDNFRAGRPRKNR